MSFLKSHLLPLPMLSTMVKEVGNETFIQYQYYANKTKQWS